LTDERLAHILEHGSWVVERPAGKVVLPFVFRHGCGRQVLMRGGENHWQGGFRSHSLSDWSN